MTSPDIALMAHLMRRAGFGAARDELEALVAKGYESTVEELLHPGDPGTMPDDIIRRLHTNLDEGPNGAATSWMYRMITTNNPLEEKLSLFFHGLFATSYFKPHNARSQLNQIDTLRRHGLGSFSHLLVELSKDPAMIFWLDNNDNRKGAVNENYGRELLELFAMGIGNYSEQDVKECARAFTGWTMRNAEYLSTRANKDSFSPYGRIAWHFQFRADDHDDGEKTFLGESGRFNGEDIVEIIARHPATGRFVCRRLFQFFASDEVDEDGERVVEGMTESYFDSKYEVRSVLRTLFYSDYFKSASARFARVKNPVELVVGAIRLAGSYRSPSKAAIGQLDTPLFMGQGLLRPPSVEGWHEAEEWIDSGALIERVNFVAGELRDVERPGVRSIIERLAAANGGTLSPAQVVDHCLDLLGPIEASEDTRQTLIAHVSREGSLDLQGHRHGDASERRVGDVLSLIGGSREFQLA